MNPILTALEYVWAALLAWFAAERWRMSLSHCFEGLLVFFPAAFLGCSWWAGLLSVVIWYWSRKKLECEISAIQPGQTHVDTWALDWFPWEWSRYQVLDVAMPTASSAMLAWLLSNIAPLHPW